MVILPGFQNQVTNKEGAQYKNWIRGYYAMSKVYNTIIEILL